VNEPVTRSGLERSLDPGAERRVVMVASAGAEDSLADVVTNLATVCAQTGQQVALLSTAGLAAPDVGAELPQSTLLWSKHSPSPGNGSGLPIEEERHRLLTGHLKPTDIEHLLGETGVPGVSRLDLRYFVGHPVQVVMRVPEVVAALRQIVDVIFLEVPSYVSVHHGEGLTPLADVVLVVAERDTTRVGDMRQMSAALRHLGAPVVGMALTDGHLEVYDWGRVDSELENPNEQASKERDPTEQLPISKSAVADPTPPLEELSVVEHAPREV
jgi:hypothetical protein